ncbi:MAG: CPBP family intramembrane metalloprotease, partial [Kiritimatiellae bacterium]|nr:CPBP family intramembrane metalloprotease [Kiritimatiellia bacterium]
YLLHAFDNMQYFKVVVSLLLQVLLQAPALEEALFRWLGWRLPVKFLSRGKSAAAWAFAVASSAAFSAAHYIDYMALAKSGGFKWLPLSNAFLALFFFGLAQCWLYRKTDRIWCPMLNHALFNLTNLVLLFVVPS